MPLRSEKDYERSLWELEPLWGTKLGPPNGGDRVDILATLIDVYETAHFPMDPPDTFKGIKFRTEQQGLTGKDLESVLGTRVSEVLNRKHDFSINTIRKVHQKLGISADVQIRSLCAL